MDIIQEKILVTGGSGLVGQAINKQINKYQNYEWLFLSSKDCDLTNFKQTKKFFNTYKPTYVIHLAANVGGLFKNMNNKVEMLEKNLEINKNVIICSHDVKVKKLIACLSTCIFPDKTTYPIYEHMLHNGPPHSSNDAYAYAKRLLEIHCRAYQEQFNDNFICIIPTNIYGPYDNYSLTDAHVIPALIHKCYLAKRDNKPFVVCGSGKPLRQFLFSNDLAKLIIWILFNYSDKTPIILAPDDEISIKDIATFIAKEFEYINKLVFDKSFSDGQYKKTVSNKKLKAQLKNFKFTNIQYGIKLTIQWFINNYDSIRK